MDTSTLLTVTGAVVTTIIGVWGTVLVARSKAKVDVGAAIASGFEALTNQLQEETERLTAIIKRQRDEISANETDMTSKDVQIRRMRRHVDTLEDLLERSGIVVPPRPWE